MNVAILGFGVVGSGVAEVITQNAEHIKENSNVCLKVTKILDIRDFPDSEFAALMTKNFDEILSDDSISIVCETMGGVNPAFDFVSKCLMKGNLLVVLITWLFLQDWRATLVPSIAIPIALIGTFPFMAALDYSINLLTMFGLILVIGSLCDDAIVVVENCQALMHRK